MNNHPLPSQSQVVTYLRDSGHEDQELSVEQQERAIRAWCEENGLLLTRIFIDAAAPGSSTIGRDAFQEMIAHFHHPDCREAGIILWKYNRFARDIDDAQYYKADLRRRGFVIHSMNDSVPTGLDGRLFESAIDWMNARYLEDLRADTKRGLHHIMDQHRAIGGTPPRGFKREPVTIGSRRDGRPHIVHRWAPDPQLIETVRLAFSMRAAGRSYREIQQATGLYKNKNCWPTFFRNRIYIGEMAFGGRLIEDYCEPIVDRATWNAVQAYNQVNWRNDMQETHNHPRRANSRFLLSGLAVCKECGSPLNGDTATAKGKYRYDYYTCSNRNRRGECQAGKIPRMALEKSVLDSLVNYILEPQHVQELTVEVLDNAEAAAQGAERQRAELAKQLSAIRRKIGNLVDVIAEKGKPARALVERVDKLEREETRLKADLERLKPSNPRMRSAEEIQELAETIRVLDPTEDSDQLRVILSGMIDRVDVKRDGQKVSGVIWYYSPVVAIDLCPRRDAIHSHNFSFQLTLQPA